MKTKSFREEKLAKRFAWWDINGDGRIGEDDFKLMARRVSEEFGYASGSTEHAAVERACARIWHELAPHAGDDRLLSEEEFIRVFSSEVAGSAESFDRLYRPLVESMLTMADADGDGTVTVSEFARFLAVTLNRPGADYAGVAKSMDRDGDGVLSFQEILAADREFYLSEDRHGPYSRLAELV